MSDSPGPETVRVKQRSGLPWRTLVASVAAVADPVDTNADVSGVRARFWHEGTWVVDIYSIVVCN